MNKDPYFKENKSFTESEIESALNAYRKVAKCSPNDVAYVFHLALTERDISLENCHRIAQQLHNESTNRLNRLRSRTTPKNGKSYNRGAYYNLSEESLDYLSNKMIGNSKNGNLMNQVEVTPPDNVDELSPDDSEWLQIRKFKKLGGYRYYKKYNKHYELFADKSAIAHKYNTHRTEVTQEFLDLREIRKI